MNCKPGDLALIVRAANKENLGVIVRVLYRAPWDGLTLLDGTIEEGFVLVMDRKLRTARGTIHPFILDTRLRPLRDPGDDATDETLLWTPVPAKETESTA